MSAENVQVKYVVQPGDDYIWEVTMKAPEKPGRYTAYFRMQTGHSVRFGHKVWCDIQVVNGGQVQNHVEIVPEMEVVPEVVAPEIVTAPTV